MKEKSPVKTTVFWIIFCLGVGALASFLTRRGLEAFDTIRKPPLTPPRIVFPIVWTILLILMGWGFARVRLLAQDDASKDRATLAFAVQLTFFFCWMIWFFGLGWYGFAGIWLAAMILAVGVQTGVYRVISKLASNLQIPYLLWCCFALYLNLGVWLLNKP